MIINAAKLKVFDKHLQDIGGLGRCGKLEQVDSFG